MTVNCVYCGHSYGPSQDTPVAMADVLKAHIEVCPEHPMSALKKKQLEMFHLLLEARDALPAIQLSSAKLHNVRLDLADRIETCLEPWRVKE